MNTRQLVVVGTALAAATAGLLTATPVDAAPSGPSGVHTTMTLDKGGAHRVTATGHAPAGARVYLQDRFDEHDIFATQKVGRASRRGTFRLTTKTDRTDGTYRVCVAGPGKDACSAGRSPRLLKRGGKITLTEVAPQIVEGETAIVAKGHLTRFLRGLPLEVQYRDPATGAWRPSGAGTSTSGALFNVTFDGYNPLRVSKQGLHLRVVVRGNSDVRTVTKGWTVNAYTWRSLTTFPVVSGSLLSAQVFVGSPLYTGSGYSEGVAAGGPNPSNSVTLTVPAGCGRIQAGITQSGFLSSPGPFTASVSRNGLTAWSFDSTLPGSPYSNEFSLDVTGGDTLTLTTSYDAAHPEERPWFVRPTIYLGNMPFALCSAP